MRKAIQENNINEVSTLIEQFTFPKDTSLLYDPLKQSTDKKIIDTLLDAQIGTEAFSMVKFYYNWTSRCLNSNTQANVMKAISYYQQALTIQKRQWGEEKSIWLW